MFAQPSYYGRNDASNKYFIGVAYGIGTTRWHSETSEFMLFDQRGAMINSGDFKIKAKNAHQILSLETVAPMSEGKWRLGMGITFEEYSLYRITIEDNNVGTNVPFVERFRFDKFFLQGEIPLKWPKSEVVGLSVNSRAGWYGFTGVRSNSLFGETRLGQTWFGGIGMVGDLKVSEQIYLVLKPLMEYKYFTNSRDEIPGRIKHRLFDYSILAGVRVHIL